jgi:hypothetical protein
VTEGRPLQAVVLALLRRRGLVSRLRLPEDRLRSFLADVEEAYLPHNPYHNSLHAADVTQASRRGLLEGWGRGAGGAVGNALRGQLLGRGVWCWRMLVGWGFSAAATIASMLRACRTLRTFQPFQGLFMKCMAAQVVAASWHAPACNAATLSA